MVHNKREFCNFAPNKRNTEIWQECIAKDL
jgi:hypothetical protein